MRTEGLNHPLKNLQQEITDRNRVAEALKISQSWLSASKEETGKLKGGSANVEG